MTFVSYDLDRAGADRLLFLFHGWSAEQHHLAAYVPLVDPAERFSAICPRGPHDLPDGDGASWFVRGADGPTPGSFLATLDAAEAFVADRADHAGIPLERCLIGGFSQGGFLSIALACRRGAPGYAGIWAMCCGLPEIEGLDLDIAAGRGRPALIQAGLRDTIIAPERGAEAAERLEQGGWTVRFEGYPMAHSQTIEMMIDARDWLGEI